MSREMQRSGVPTTELARAIRRQALQMVHRAKASHIASALSIADIVAVLYGEVMNVFPSEPLHVLRDRFLLSKGHACVAVYAALAETGYFPEADLLSYGADFSPLMNHISHKVPGVEFSTGSLGHALSFGVGKALAAKRNASPWRTFVILSDGELDEGSNWEAIMFAAHHKLDNLIAIIDYNKLQSLTSVAATLGLEPLEDKFRSFGWEVSNVDGHDHAALRKALLPGNLPLTRPFAVLAHTTKGKGVSFMEGRVEWHYKSPNDDQLAAALLELEGQLHA